MQAGWSTLEGHVSYLGGAGMEILKRGGFVLFFEETPRWTVFWGERLVFQLSSDISWN